MLRIAALLLRIALGGIFLVRYTIQQGLIGPGVRIFLGASLAAALVAAGEWARRQENLSGLPGLPSANIPSILTAAGTTVAAAADSSIGTLSGTGTSYTIGCNASGGPTTSPLPIASRSATSANAAPSVPRSRTVVNPRASTRASRRAAASAT